MSIVSISLCYLSLVTPLLGFALRGAAVSEDPAENLIPLKSTVAKATLHALSCRMIARDEKKRRECDFSSHIRSLNDPFACTQFKCVPPPRSDVKRHIRAAHRR